MLAPRTWKRPVVVMLPLRQAWFKATTLVVGLRLHLMGVLLLFLLQLPAPRRARLAGMLLMLLLWLLRSASRGLLENILLRLVL